MSLTHHQQTLKSQFITQGGIWSSTWENILSLDPGYFAAYLKLRSVPIQKQKLPTKIQELLLISIEASCTTLFLPGIRAHTAAALAAGATKEEIMEVLELSSVLGVHAVNVGVPLLSEVLEEEGLDKPGSASVGNDVRREHLKSEFTKKRGYWHETWDQVLSLDPDFFEAYTEFSSHPFRQRQAHEHAAGQHGQSPTGLSPKVKEFVYCAIDSATTHLYVQGLKLHIRNAVRYGATPEEVMEVFELASLMGVHTVMAGADILAEEIGKVAGAGAGPATIGK